MGGSSKSSTSSTIAQTDRRIAATDSAVVAADGGRVSSNVRVTTADATIARAAFAESRKILDSSLAAARERAKGDDQVLLRALDIAGASAGATESLAAQALSQATAPDLAGLQSSLKSTTAIALVAVGAVLIFSRR